MRVLMIAPEPFLEPRGTPISVYQRLRALSMLGHTVDLLTYHVGQDVSLPGVTLHRVSRVGFIREVKIGPSWSKLLLDGLLFLKAAWMLTRTRYHAIHSHEEAAFFSMVLAALFSTRHVYDMHSNLPRQLADSSFGRWWPLVRLFAMLEWRVLETCDAVITIGVDLEEHVRRVSPKANPCTIENTAIDLPPTAPGTVSPQELRARLGINGRLPIVYTGSLEEYQGLDLLLDSACIVRERNAEAVFILIGGRPAQIAKCQEKIRKLHLEDSAYLLGAVPPEESTAYLEMAEILVSPRVAGLSVPLKIYSYLRAGKPLVATNIAAHTQVLSDETAILVEPTKEALAEGILELLADEELRHDLGCRSQQSFRTGYDFAGYAAKVGQVYLALGEQLPALHQPAPAVKR